MTYLAQRVFYELSDVKVYVYTTVRSDATSLSKHLRATEGQLQTFSLLTEVDWINGWTKQNVKSNKTKTYT